jgi:hypothetical protein
LSPSEGSAKGSKIVLFLPGSCVAGHRELSQEPVPNVRQPALIGPRDTKRRLGTERRASLGLTAARLDQRGLKQCTWYRPQRTQ